MSHLPRTTQQPSSTDATETTTEVDARISTASPVEHPLRDIFFVSNSVDELGGVTSWSHQMARLFSDLGHTVQVIGITPAPEGRQAALGDGLPYGTTSLYEAHPPKGQSLKGVSGRLNVAERRRQAARRAGMEEQAAKLTRMFRAARPGAVVIVTQVWAMEWVALADTKGLTVIGMSHESFKASRKTSRFQRIKRWYPEVDRLLVLTREDADLWICQQMNNVGFMPNPLPFFPDEPSRREAKTVVSIGRLSHEKGVDMLLDTWAQVAPGHPDWRLKIFGTGEDEAKLQQLAADLGITGSVDWMGRTDDVPQALRESSVFTLTSRDEGFPLAPMEAMASAVPCVAFDMAPGIREIITDGEDGYVVRPGNTAEFAARLDSLMSDRDLRDRMGTAGRESIQRFSTERITARWEDLFAFLER
ncbi:glycosyltransferase [Streptomyces sp. NBC_00237]|uniref:glycosyltransferase n=1 Tax=Streptomyces sp. NBC_00237 TaxID=2975687 RepID=UPI00224F89BB|nr:glycosyltransferase [Streptomyces sp. NBC_00237]MCX5200934.1 glycosyltransferase [Streptomyces sp. NBC_00237]